jgi:hypothetical protein
VAHDLLLEDYITPEEAEKQPGMPCARTLRRMIARRELPATHFGRKLLIHIPTFKEILREREVKVLRGRK